MKIKKFSNKFIQDLLTSNDVMDEAVLRGYADSLPYAMSQADDVAASFGLTLEKWATEQKGFIVSDNFFIEDGNGHFVSDSSPAFHRRLREVLQHLR